MGGRLRLRAALLALVVPSAALAATAPPPKPLPPPVNDARSHALLVPAAHTALWGRTTQATLAYNDPETACGRELGATVWYRVDNPPPYDLVLRLEAKGELHAVIALYRFVDGRRKSLICDSTSDSGVATIGLAAHKGDVVLVGRESGSAAGRFTLSTLVPQPAEHAPGHPLHRGVSTTVQRFLDTQDIWNVTLKAGITYRLRLLSGGVSAVVVSPATHDSVVYLYGNRYELFTPGPSGGGRYLIEVTPGYQRGPMRYSLRVAPAGADDTGPGRPLRAGPTAGELDPRGIDMLDLYRFTLPVRSDVLVSLHPRTKGIQMQLRRDDGSSIAAGEAVRRALPAGSYDVAVSASPDERATKYTLVLRTHEVSRLSSDVTTAGFGSPVVISARIGRPAGKRATLQLDRLDPLEGWVFDRVYRLRVGKDRAAVLRWHPPSVGYFRVRITSPSRSGYLYLHIRA